MLHSIETPTESPTAPSAWDAEYQLLRERFPGAKPTVLFCVHTLLSDPDIAIDDLKARAEVHGLRVTLGSWNAARMLLAPPKPKPQATVVAPEVAVEAAPTTTVAKPEPLAPPTPPKFDTRPKRAPAPQPAAPQSLEQMIVRLVEEARAEERARADRLEAALREALGLIRAILAH